MLIEIIFIAVLIVAIIALMVLCINILQENEQIKKSNEELFNANYKLTKKKNESKNSN